MWHQAVHEWIVKKLLASQRFHRFVRVSNAYMKGEPVPPKEDVAASGLEISWRKLKMFGKLWVEEFKNEFTGRRHR